MLSWFLQTLDAFSVSSPISNGRKDGAGRESASGGRRGEGEGEREREREKCVMRVEAVQIFLGRAKPHAATGVHGRGFQ